MARFRSLTSDHHPGNVDMKSIQVSFLCPLNHNSDLHQVGSRTVSHQELAHDDDDDTCTTITSESGWLACLHVVLYSHVNRADDRMPCLRIVKVIFLWLILKHDGLGQWFPCFFFLVSQNLYSIGSDAFCWFLFPHCFLDLPISNHSLPPPPQNGTQYTHFDCH